MRAFFSKPKNIGHYEVGGFIVDFYSSDKDPAGNKVCINTVSKNFSAAFTGYPYGYLYASVKDGDLDNLHGFCALIYMVGDAVFQDKGFADDLVRAINKRTKRLLKQGESEAKSASAAAVAADEALLDEVLAEATMGKKERAKKREEDAAAMREIISGKGEPE